MKRVELLPRWYGVFSLLGITSVMLPDARRYEFQTNPTRGLVLDVARVIQRAL